MKPELRVAKQPTSQSVSQSVSQLCPYPKLRGIHPTRRKEQSAIGSGNRVKKKKSKHTNNSEHRSGYNSSFRCLVDALYFRKKDGGKKEGKRRMKGEEERRGEGGLSNSSVESKQSSLSRCRKDTQQIPSAAALSLSLF